MRENMPGSGRSQTEGYVDRGPRPKSDYDDAKSSRRTTGVTFFEGTQDDGTAKRRKTR